MNQIYSQYNLERLRLQQSQKDSIKLERTDIKRGTGKNAIRKIFGIEDSTLKIYQFNSIYSTEELDEILI